MNAQQARIRALLDCARRTATSSAEVPVDVLNDLAAEGYPLASLDDDLETL